MIQPDERGAEVGRALTAAESRVGQQSSATASSTPWGT